MLNISFFVGDEQRIKACYSGRAGTTTMDNRLPDMSGQRNRRTSA